MDYRQEQMSNEFTKHLFTLDDNFHFVIHNFTGTDKGGPHDHPWDFTTHILQGGYVERVYTYDEDGQWGYDDIYRAPGTTHKVQANCVHEIIELPEGTCKTLVIPSSLAIQTSGFYQFKGDGVYHRFWNEPEYKKL